MANTIQASPPAQREPNRGSGRWRGRHGGRRPRRRRLVILGLIALLVVLGVPAGGAWYVGHRITSQITRLHGVFDNLPARPPRPTTGAAANAINILLMGTDRRSPVATTGSAAQAPVWIPGEQRSDTMMILHIDADRRGVSVISIPRDSWVYIPGHGMAKINAAFSWGGPSLAVATVERLTGVRIDHIAIVDWAGYKAMIDKVGGIDVTIPSTVYDSARHYTWTAGTHHLDGTLALLYARDRYGLPEGDIDRVRRQQEVVRELSKKVLAEMGSPMTMYGLLDVLSQHLTIDSGWSSSALASLAFSLRDLHGDEVKYLTAPLTGTGMVGDQSVVFLDASADAGLWTALRADSMGAWEHDHAGALTPTTVD